MPTRIIRDGILTSERVNALSPHAELFYRRLMSVVDDYGRFPATPMLLRASCYPLKLDSVKEDSISKHLTECADARLIVLYTVAGKALLELQDFGQRVNGKAKYAGPSEGIADIPRESPGIPGNPRLGGDVVGGVDEGDKELSTSLRSVEAGFDESAPAEPPSAKKPKRAVVPLAQIVELYHEKLPMCPRLEKLTGARAGHLRQRWMEDLPTLDAWSRYFDDVGKSRFLTGHAPGRDGKPPFVASLEWLSKPNNFAKVAEGNYHR